DTPIPRPANWSGFRLVPDSFEFWQDRPYRLHDRATWTRTDKDDWTRQRLYP
ncbi:pyridoxamine 5'-phosphate oxidase, partial [Gluconacetobacter entanii]